MTTKKPLQRSRRTKTNTEINSKSNSRTQKTSILCLRRLVATAFAAALLAGLPAALAATPSEAQKAEGSKPDAKPYALIFGTVWSPDRQPMYGVKIKIRRADEKKARWELYSNHTGEFAQRVPAGKADYLISADLKGYKLPSGKHVKSAPEVTVHVENDERVNTGIHLDW